MIPKTDQELRDMGWVGLDKYHDSLLTCSVYEENVELIKIIKQEIARVERMMELVD